MPRIRIEDAARGPTDWVPLTADSAGRLYTVLSDQAVTLSSNTYGYAGAGWVPISADSAGRLFTVLASAATVSANVYGYNSDTTAWAPLLVDDETGALVSLSVEHNQVHEGNMYTCDWWVGDVSNAASANLMFHTSTTKDCHVLYEVVGEGEFHFYLYESATYASGGTTIPIINKDRRSANTTTASAHHTPGTPATASTTLLRQRHWGSGTTPAIKAAIGGGDRSLLEFILKKDTKYLFQVINQSGGNVWAIFHLDWYEKT